MFWLDRAEKALRTMKTIPSPYGVLRVGSHEEIFKRAVALVDEHCRKNNIIEPSWALAGGATAQTFFRFCVANNAIPERLLKSCAWFVSDERMVPLDSAESNFGNAERLLLDPLGIPFEKRYPWPTEHIEANASAALFAEHWASEFSPHSCFDICFLGMGDDCHTASIFPYSPLLRNSGQSQQSMEKEERELGGNDDCFFAHVEVPGRGHRLTITPAGLAKCGLIVVFVTGEAKAIPLSMALDEIAFPERRPVQLLSHHADRTVWLLDEPAASRCALIRRAATNA